MDWIHTFASNPIFTGVMGGSVLMSLLYTLRSVPEKVGGFVLWRLTTELMVFTGDVSFEAVDDWLAKRSSARRARTMRLTTKWSASRRRDEFSVTFGIGRHLVWYRSRPILVKREFENKESSTISHTRQEMITITTVGTSPRLILQFVEDVVANHYGEESDYVTVYLFKDYWRLAARRDKRALDTVVLPEGVGNDLVEDATRFLSSRQWYSEHGVPWRRGYLFFGPPGCGKTSLVFAFAGHLSKRIYVLNMGSVTDDDALIEAVTGVPEDAILLIEDVDAAQRDRAAKVVKSPGNKADVVEKQVTMSGLLNAIDGVFSAEGRILVMTTNYADRIDSALLRPGRVDKRVRLDPLGPVEVESMCRRFGVSVPDDLETPVAAAVVQERILRDRA